MLLFLGVCHLAGIMGSLLKPTVFWSLLETAISVRQFSDFIVIPGLYC